MKFKAWIPILGVWTHYPIKDSWFMTFFFYQVMITGITTMLTTNYVGHYIYEVLTK